MCEVLFVTKSGTFTEQFSCIDQVAARAKEITGLLCYRCMVTLKTKSVRREK